MRVRVPEAKDSGKNVGDSGEGGIIVQQTSEANNNSETNEVIIGVCGNPSGQNNSKSNSFPPTTFSNNIRYSNENAIY